VTGESLLAVVPEDVVPGGCRAATRGKVAHARVARCARATPAGGDTPQSIDVDGFTVSDARELAEDELLVQIQSRADVLLDMVVWRGVIRLNGSVEEATIGDFERLPGSVELQRRIDRRAGQALIEQLESQPTPAPQVSGYLPPEPLFSSVEEVTVEDWRVTGGVVVESVADRAPDGILLELRVEASADITWLVSAPDPQDLDRFASLAEGVEDGAGSCTTSPPTSPSSSRSPRSSRRTAGKTSRSTTSR
jgi:hypothetical protein